jgi:hypothetical protein
MLKDFSNYNLFSMKTSILHLGEVLKKADQKKIQGGYREGQSCDHTSSSQTTLALLIAFPVMQEAGNAQVRSFLKNIRIAF